MRRFTVEVKQISQSSISSFQDLKLFHKECGSFSIIQGKINPTTWGLICKRCKKKILIKNNSLGTMPIIQTAVDGEEREFVHEMAKEKVISK